MNITDSELFLDWAKLKLESLIAKKKGRLPFVFIKDNDNRSWDERIIEQQQIIEKTKNKIRINKLKMLDK